MEEKKENFSFFIKIKHYVKRIFSIVKREEMRILPGNIAFFLVLSLIPIITLIGFVGAHFTDSYHAVINFIDLYMPKEVTELLSPFFNNVGSQPTNMFIYVCIGFIVASNGMSSIITATNTLYHIQTKDPIHHQVKSIILTLVLMMLFTFILIVLGFSNVIYHTLLRFKVISNFGIVFTIFRFLKWPFAFFMIFYVIRLLYTMASNKRILSKYFTKGALFTTCGWIIATAIYSFYTSNLAHYDIFYGGLSNIIILMIWVYFLSYVLVIGMVINADTYEQVGEK